MQEKQKTIRQSTQRLPLRKGPRSGGAGVNDMPVACQSCAPECPQAFGAKRLRGLNVTTWTTSPSFARDARKCHRLAAARSRRGSDSPPGCHSTPRRRFATLHRGGYPLRQGRAGNARPYEFDRTSGGERKGDHWSPAFLRPHSFLSLFEKEKNRRAR